MAKRNAAGGGSIRQKTRTINGKSYPSWEARVSVGHDPVTGKLIRRTICGKTQAEVRQKMNALIKSVDEGSYQEPSKMTVSQWMDTWMGI